MMGPFIRGTEYNAEKKTLTVRFATSTWVYHGVPEHVGKGIDSTFQSSEVEHVFNTAIEGKYKSTREGA